MKKTLLGLVISLFFLYLVLRQIDFSRLAHVLTQVNYFIVIMAVCFHFVGFWLRTVRWRYLLHNLKKLETSKLFPYLAIGYMANNVLFLRLGEVVRAYVTGSRFEVSKTSMLAVIFAERLYDGLSLVIAFGLMILVLPLPNDLKAPLLWASLLFGVVAVGVFIIPFLEKTKPVRKIFAFIESKDKLKKPFEMGIAFLDGLKTLKTFKDVFYVLILSILIWAIEGGMFYLIALSFPVHISLAQATIVALVVGLSTLIPSGPGYVGTYEFFFVSTVKFFKVDPNLAVSYALLTHFAQWLPITLVGFYYSWKMGISISTLSKNKKVSK